MDSETNKQISKTTHHEPKSYLISQRASFEANFEEFLRTLDEVEDDAILWESQLHDDVVIELPFAGHTSIPDRIEGKADCMEYIRRWYNLFADFRIAEMRVRPLEETDTYLLEYKTHGFAAATAKPYNQDNVAILKLKDHKIIHIREYWNPIHLIEAFGEELPEQLNLNFIDLKSVEPF
jgi:ketosteroid isomerase-like protein